MKELAEIIFTIDRTLEKLDSAKINLLEARRLIIEEANGKDVAYEPDSPPPAIKAELAVDPASLPIFTL